MICQTYLLIYKVSFSRNNFNRDFSNIIANFLLRPRWHSCLYWWIHRSYSILWSMKQGFTVHCLGSSSQGRGLRLLGAIKLKPLIHLLSLSHVLLLIQFLGLWFTLTILALFTPWWVFILLTKDIQLEKSCLLGICSNYGNLQILPMGLPEIKVTRPISVILIRRYLKCLIKFTYFNKNIWFWKEQKIGHTTW